MCAKIREERQSRQHPVLWPLKGLRQDNPGFEVSLGLKMTVCQQISQRQVRVCTL